MTCGECEYFGDYDHFLPSAWEPVPGTGGKQLYQPFAGFDTDKGAICAYPRTGTKTRAYDSSPACACFKPCTWTRPENCDNCDRCHGRTSDGSYLCNGYPFYKKVGREPCGNGKAHYGENIKLF